MENHPFQWLNQLFLNGHLIHSKLLIYQIWWLWHRDCNNGLLVDMAMDSSLIYQIWWASIVYQRVYYACLGLLHGSRKLFFFSLWKNVFCFFFTCYFSDGMWISDTKNTMDMFDGNITGEHHQLSVNILPICNMYIEQHPHLSSDGYMINPHLYHHNLAG